MTTRPDRYAIYVNQASDGFGDLLRFAPEGEGPQRHAVTFASYDEALASLKAAGFVDSTFADVPNSAYVCYAPPERAVRA